MEKRIKEIENDMDIRVESLINEIHVICDNYRAKLIGYKESLKK